MLITGEVSGIQDYLFDIPASGGHQARRLRGRSFFLRILPELICQQIVTALGWKDPENVLFNAAGKFLIQGSQWTESSEREIRQVQAQVSRWLTRSGYTDVRFTLAWSDHGATAVEQWRALEQARDTGRRVKLYRAEEPGITPYFAGTDMRNSALLTFLFRLFIRLRDLGTVPAMDLEKYARFLNEVREESL